MIFDSGDTGDAGGYQIANSVRLRQPASAMLTRTPTVNGSSTKGTLSCWVKFSGSGTYGLIGCRVDANNFFMLGISDNRFGLWMQTSASWRAIVFTAGQFRDPSAWYHVVIHYDTSGGVGAGTYLKVYVNGVQQTLSTYVTPNGTPFTGLNSTSYQMQIGYGYSAAYLDGYLADYYWFDGQEKSASDFGEFNSDGVWVPKKYSGTFPGNNDSYLPFNDGSNLTNLCLDRSGKGNNWTATNVSLTAGSTYDWMLDTPTKNYWVLNSLNPIATGVAYSEGNLKLAIGSPSGGKTAKSTMPFPSSGLTYLEVLSDNGSDASTGIGFGFMVGSAWYYLYASSAAAFYANGSTQATGMALIGGGITYQLALDAATGKAWIGRNNVWYNSAGGTTGDPSTGANPTFTLPAGECFPFIYGDVTTTITFKANFGQRPFTYTPPTGFKALCTANMPAVAIPNPRLHHDVVTVTKSGNTNFTIPWDATLYDTYFEIKRRDAGSNWHQIDGLRGYDKVLYSNGTGVETTDANVLGISGTTGTLKSTLADGTYVVSMWKAGLASARQTNTSGSITSTVSTNVTAGFSIVVYSGTGANATVGHGLGVVPKDIRWKNRSSAVNWVVYNATIGAGNVLFLDATNASTANATAFNSTAPTSSVFSLGSYTNTNGSTHSMVAYCHAEVPGYSKFGSFACNASADGPLGYLGFTPKSLELKASTNASNWFDWDTVRSPYNALGVNGEILFKNTSGAEGSSGYLVDANAGAFKVRTAGGYGFNESGQTTVFMAYAKHPLGGSNVAPAPAR